MDKQQEFLEILKNPHGVWLRNQVAKFMGLNVTMQLAEHDHRYVITVTLQHADQFIFLNARFHSMFPSYKVMISNTGSLKTYIAPDGDVAYRTIYFVYK